MPGWFVHFAADFGNVKKDENRVQKGAARYPSERRGLKLFGQYPYGINKKGLSEESCPHPTLEKQGLKSVAGMLYLNPL